MKIASFVNKENANALRTELLDNVKHLWVLVFAARPSNNFFDVSVQHSSDSPISKSQSQECESVLKFFIPPIPEANFYVNNQEPLNDPPVPNL